MDCYGQISILNQQIEELIARQWPAWVPIDYIREIEGNKITTKWVCRLPKNGEDVLVSLTYGDVMAVTYNDKIGFGGFRPEELTAWVHFPMPYKED